MLQLGNQEERSGGEIAKLPDYDELFWRRCKYTHSPLHGDRCGRDLSIVMLYDWLCCAKR